MGAGEFSYPRAAVADLAGLIYTVDKAARIQCHRVDGELVRLRRTPEKDAGKPTGLGVGRGDRVDSGNNRVQIMAGAGWDTWRAGQP
jgi:hypothetical protein